MPHTMIESDQANELGDTSSPRPTWPWLIITGMCQLYNILITARITSIVCHSQLNNFIIHTNQSSENSTSAKYHNSIFKEILIRRDVFI